jgi:hypothetical protein
LPAEGEYLRTDDFLELDFFAVDFLGVDLRVLFVALERELLLPDFFLVAFLVAITILLGGQMACGLRQVVYQPSD